MRILSKPDGVDDLLNNIDINSSIDTILALDEPVGVVELRNKKDVIIAEINNYHIEMSQNGYLSHDLRIDLSKYKAIFLWLYKNPSKKRKTKYIDSIREIYSQNGIICPYCGIASCKTLDHYYNQALLPQFSLLPNNFIPCCGDCNKDKGTKKSFSKWRRFINPFYDDFSSLEENEPLIYIIFKEKPNPAIDMSYIITANHKLDFLVRKQINYHIRTVKIPLRHTEAISNSFWRNSRDLIQHRKLLTNNMIDDTAYNAIIDNFITKNKAMHYDWEYIVRYSIAKLQVNHWIYDSNLPKLT